MPQGSYYGSVHAMGFALVWVYHKLGSPWYSCTVRLTLVQLYCEVDLGTVVL